MDDAAIEQELKEAQAALADIPRKRVRRQEAVIRAREAGWSKYKIAATLGVKGPTVDSIISAAERTEEPSPASAPPVAAELTRERARVQRDDPGAGSARSAIRNLPSMR